MAYLTPSDVGDWLEHTKFSVSSIDDVREQWATHKVLGRLRSLFDTSTWLDRDSTPSLIVSLIGQCYAAAEYRKQYSEDLEDGVGLNYAEWLEQSNATYIQALLDGDISLDELDSVLDASLLRPSFYPNDASSIDEPAKFSMSQEF